MNFSARQQGVWVALIKINQATDGGQGGSWGGGGLGEVNQGNVR